MSRGVAAIAFMSAIVAQSACTLIFNISEKSSATGPVDAGEDAAPVDCSGPQMRTCEGATVDVCTDANHCGACGAKCTDAEGLQRCVVGLCHDHAFTAWRPGDGVDCAPHREHADILVDANTGLWWEAPVQNPVTQFDDAVAHCDARNAEAFGGYSDWALPSRIELMTTLDFSSKTPVANKCGWVVPQTSYICTRSVRADDPTEHWLLNIQYGTLSTLPIGDPAVASANVRCRPRCVRATKYAASNRLIPVSDGVYDPVTNLTWEKTVASGAAGQTKPPDGSGTDDAETRFSQTGGFVYCRERRAIRDAWRLPTLKELATIVDERRTNPPIDPKLDVGNPIEKMYWTDTPNRGTAIDFPQSLYWVVWFERGQSTGAVDGEGDGGIPPSYARVRCVHPRNVDAK